MPDQPQPNEKIGKREIPLEGREVGWGVEPSPALPRKPPKPLPPVPDSPEPRVATVKRATAPARREIVAKVQSPAIAQTLPSSAPCWTPPRQIEELYSATAGNKFAAINAPTAGARFEFQYPAPKTGPFQLYSLATPNGHKVGILLEELNILYDAYTVNIGKGDQFSTGFVQANPNSKIPAAIDFDGPGGKPINLFESGSIMLYLCRKHGRFLPKDPRLEQECLNWLFWQMAAQGPMLGNFGHFMVYAPEQEVAARNYGVARYGMESQRLADTLNKHLEGKTYMVGEEYTVADMACMPWARQLFFGYKHPSGISARDFLSADKYKNVKAWVDRLCTRPAVQRGLKVCSSSPKPWLENQSSKL